MSDNLKVIGDILKEKRLKLGKSLEDISRETRVREKYLSAIEEANRSSLPADIYMQGYLKAFAIAVGIDPKEIIDKYQEITNTVKPVKKVEIIETPKLAKAKVLPISFSGIIILAGVMIILITVVLLLNNKGNDLSSEKPPKLEALLDSTMAGKLAPGGAGSGITQNIYCKIGPINPQWAISRVDSVTLDIEFKEATTILLETDYRRAYKGYVPANTKKSWRAKDSFFMTVSKPNTLKMQFNGFNLVTFPPKATVMDIYINRSNVITLIDDGSKKAFTVKQNLSKIKTVKPSQSPDTSKAKIDETPADENYDDINIEE